MQRDSDLRAAADDDIDKFREGGKTPFGCNWLACLRPLVSVFVFEEI